MNAKRRKKCLLWLMAAGALAGAAGL